MRGWLRSGPSGGTFVRFPDRREVVELFELEEILEGVARRLLA
ncbi:hypothetical protein ACWDKQ_29780 [Saccharopolyspora sp. NPDC000995]